MYSFISRQRVKTLPVVVLTRDRFGENIGYYVMGKLGAPACIVVHEQRECVCM